MEAEGKAMLRAVTIAREFDPQHIIVHTDCTPLQRKLLEESSPSKPLYQTIRSEINDFEHSTVRDIPRKRNETADDLASLALRRAKDNEIAS
jgi:ribonuclease HI